MNNIKVFFAVFATEGRIMKIIFFVISSGKGELPESLNIL
jgi:hypothetical protein